MAFQVLQDPSRGAIGDAIGSAVSTGLQSLVQHKLGQIQEHKQRQDTVRGLQALGYSPKEATELSHFDPQIIGEIAKRKLAEPGEMAYANALSSLLGGQPAQQQAQQPELSAAQTPALPSIEKLSPKQKEQLKKYLASPKAPKVYAPEVINRIKESLEPQRVVAPKVAEQPKGPSFKGLNAKQATEIAKLGLEQQKLSRQERSEAFKETKALREEIRSKKNSAKAKLEDLDRMEELEKEGKLDTAGYSEFLKRSGLDIPALMNEGSEEFNKIATNFIRDAKEYFGGRISNFEIEQFLKTVPSLSQSPEGRKRVIANLRRIEQLGVATYDAYKEVLKENNGVPPLDLGEQVDDKLDKKRNAITERFKKDLAKPVPSGQNQLVTAVQSGLGSIVGAPGALLSKIGGLLG